MSLRIALLLLSTVSAKALCQAADPTPQQIEDALHRAVDFFRNQVASHGGYVYRYSADLQKREGEGKVGPDTVWVQPPGTPAVGLAYLDAYERTGFPWLRDAAVAAGECLVQGQLHSGGWQDHIDFGAAERPRLAYRVEPQRKKARNHTSFDDDKTQSALRFLMRLDQALEFDHERIHEATQFSLDCILKAQFPNGGWTQVYDHFPDGSQPVGPSAAYPELWPRHYPGGDYWEHFTLNDNAMSDTITMLLLAARIYNEPRYREAALRGGDFLLRAQMPSPQPAWAQQYNRQMHPVWARKFEPPAISGSESQGVLLTLLDLWVETGDDKYLKAIPPALDYLKRSLLADGQLARFYELRTNRPLYFTKTYELTFDDSDLPTHYGFKVSSKLDNIAAQFAQLKSLSAGELARRRESRFGVRRGRPSSSEIAAVIQQLDGRGAWVESGRLRYHGGGDPTRDVIETATFIRNVTLLSQALDRGR